MLTQFAITNAKPKAKPYKLSDGEGSGCPALNVMVVIC